MKMFFPSIFPFSNYIFEKADDIYPTGLVHTEENSCYTANCRSLNEGKLVGCPMVVPGQMKYRRGGTTYVGTISALFIQPTTGCVRTEELDSV